MACKKGKVNFKIYDVINWETNDYNTYIVQYREKERQSNNEIGRLVDWNMRNIFLKNLTQNVVNKLVPAPLPKNQN